MKNRNTSYNKSEIATNLLFKNAFNTYWLSHVKISTHNFSVNFCHEYHYIYTQTV